MNRMKSLLWKEWHEVWVLLAIALFVFLGLPIIGAMEDGMHRFLASPWVFLLGGLLAALIGVGTVTRDLNGRLEDFWRSRPVSVVRWLLVKYLVGLAVVIVALGIPLIAEIMLQTGVSAWTNPRLILAWNPFVWAAGYSVAFAVACLIRRAAQAAIISIVALLLLYFLPYLLPPIQFLELTWVMDAGEFPRRVPWMPWRVPYEPRQLLFVLGMTVVSVGGLLLAIAAVKRDWRVESGRKMIYWSIGGVALLILCSVAFQVGTNLPVIQVLDLPLGAQVVSIQSDGSLGAMVTDTQAASQTSLTQPRPARLAVQSLRIASSGVEFGPSIPLRDNLYGQDYLWLPEQPNDFYVLGLDHPASKDDTNYPTLSVVDLHEPTVRIETQSFPNDGWDHDWPGCRLYPGNHRLYLLLFRLRGTADSRTSKCLTFDLSEPLKPRFVAAESITWRSMPWTPSETRFLHDTDGEAEAGRLTLPDSPCLTPRQRLELLLEQDALFSGDILTRTGGGRLTTYHLDELTDHSATFHKLGRYEPTSLESLYGSNVNQFVQANGLLCETLGSTGFAGARLVVFSIDGPRPKPVGHFAAPHEAYFRILCVLPDGRLLLSASERRLYLLGPPPGKR